MSLHGFRKSKEPELQRPLDVRGLGLDFAKTEKQPYPFPAEIEIPVTAGQWKEWEKESQDIGMTLAEYYYLAIIDHQRTRRLISPEIKISFKKLLSMNADVEISDNLLSAWCNYCFIFTESVTELGVQDIHLLVEKIKGLHQTIYRKTWDSNWDGLLKSLRDARILLPEVFNDAYCEQYWKNIFAFAYPAKDVWQSISLSTLASMRVVFPRHLEELQIEKYNIPELIIPGNLLMGAALSRIVARPEIPGLTTWPPKKTGEPQFADNIPGQPEALKL